MAIKDPVVGHGAYDPEHDVTVVIKGVEDTGVTVRAIDAKGEEFGVEFLTDPDTLEEPRPRVLPGRTLTATRPVRPAPDGEAAFGHLAQVGHVSIEMSQGMAQKLAGLITEQPGKLSLSVDEIAGATMVIAEVTTDGQHDGKMVRRWIIGDAGVLDLGYVS